MIMITLVMMIDDYDYDDIDDDHDDFGGAGGATKRRSLPMGSSAHCTSLDICFYTMTPNLATHLVCKLKMSASKEQDFCS